MPDLTAPVTGAVFTADPRFPPTDVDPELTSGEGVFDRYLIGTGTGVTLSSGILRLVAFKARRTELVNRVRVTSGSTAAAATPTLVRAGVYQIDAAGNGTLIASTPNDTTLFAAINTPYTKALSAGFTKVEGTRYAVGHLVVTAVAAPTVGGNAMATAAAADLFMLPWKVASLAGQADLPASFTYASLSSTGVAPYSALVP